MIISMTTTNYGIADEHGTDYTVGLQGDVVARRTAQRLANDHGKPVYLYEVGSDAEPEEIEPSIHVAASIATPSGCTDAPGAVDIDVTVTIGNVQHDGEVTLAPQQSDGRLAAYGSAPDYWISGDLLAELYAACERITGAPRRRMPAASGSARSVTRSKARPSRLLREPPPLQGRRCPPRRRPQSP